MFKIKKMYQEGQYVRVEGTNELKLVKEVVEVNNKSLYICCDDRWYDEDTLYPHEMKIDIKNTLNQCLSISDFGEPKTVMEEVVREVSKMNEKEFNEFFSIIKDIELEFEDL